MNNARMIIMNIIVLIILVGGAFAGYYFYNESINYIKTDNARIDGQAITIAAPASGKLETWKGKTGKKYDAGDKVGTIAVAPNASTPKGAGGSVTMDVTVPSKSTIVQQSAVENSFVSAGMTLAQAFDMDNLWVTANIDETDIDDVEVGQTVDLYVDAYPNTTLTGKVDEIGLATASTFSLLPTANADGNYTKVTQVIPVKITIDGYKGLKLAPGMNVSVRIHK